MAGTDEVKEGYARNHRGSLSLHEEAERYFAAGGATHIV
jgi:hypothetical protein